MLAVWSNDCATGRTELCKTQWLVYYMLSKIDKFQFVNIFYANKVAIYVL